MRGSCESPIPLNGCKGTKFFSFLQIICIFSFQKHTNSLHQRIIFFWQLR